MPDIKLRILAGIVTVVAAGSVDCQPAAAVVALHVRPHQRFGGTVNDTTGNAAIAMGCFGPVRPGQTGHPLAGQHVGVFVPEVLMNPAFGDTGARGRRIVARVVSAEDRPVQVAVFTRFTRTGAVYSATKPLPTTITLPCTGTATVVFSPVLGSAEAKPATVTVVFNGQP